MIALQLTGQQVLPGTFSLNESLIESLASQNAGDEEYENLLNELDVLRKNPVNLNSCKRGDLEKLPFLSDFQINSFLEYRKEKGKLLSVYELQAIYGFSDDVIQMILPFVIVPDESVSGLVESSKFLRHEASLRMQRTFEKSKGYSVPDPVEDRMRYPGSPCLINSRYDISYGSRLKAGVTVEKDPGEELFRGTSRGFDFISAYMNVNNAGAFKAFLIGDYRLAFGQGLTLWSGTAPGKSSMPLGIVKRQDAIKPYTSNDENNFFRGVAASAVIGKFTLTSFFSSKTRDANITDTLESDHVYFSSFQESGYHRTSSEIADEKTVRETLYGANLNFRTNILKLGITVANYRLDKYLEAGDALRNVHEFSGNSLFNLGIDYSLVFKNIQFFGETSYGNGHLGTLNGMLINTGKYASLSLLYRYYDPGFFSMHSSAFSEGSDDYNEEGLYAGIVVHPVRHLKISAYADFYRFPWLKFQQSKPASGNDFLIQADYRAGENTEMYLRLKFEEDPRDYIPDSSIIPEIAEVERSGIRYNIRYRISERVFMQNRFEMVLSDDSKGFLLYHDVSYQLDKIPAEFDFR
ncbi:MAG TPA: helix-hairpin-helix domain-containing protein, partial [Bacteroidales bacterium]|nr:helix-hairpin-helix domain-containing protein [Bacteroidales bacterium]